jgi:transposase
VLDTETGELVEKVLVHEGGNVWNFYSTLPRPVRVGIEATGSMQWFVDLMEELGIECQAGHPAEIRAAEPRKQKQDRRDADLILKLLVENRFPSIWLPSRELLDLRALLRHRHQWVRMRTRVQNALQAMALANGLRRGPSLWSQTGQQAIASLPLGPHTAYRRSELQALYGKFEAEIEKLNQRVEEQAQERSRRRGRIVEFCHAWIKSKLGLRQFPVRGLAKAQMEMLWACLTYNLQHGIRLSKLRATPVVT